MKIDVAVKGVILKDDRILVIKRSEREDCFANLWDIPGGKIEFGERLDDALKREIKEETSLDVDVLIPVAAWSFFRNRETYVVGITFLCRPVTNRLRSDEIKLGNEHVEYRWVSRSGIENLPMNENLKKELKLFFKRKHVFEQLARE